MELYEPSQAVIAGRSQAVQRVEAHAVDDEEAADLLWLETTPESDFSEGEVLTISPATADRSLWFASIDWAYKAGGWSTSWKMTGTASEVVLAVLSVLTEGRETS